MWLLRLKKGGSGSATLVAVISNFLAFFQFIVDKFTLLDPDPDPGGIINADPCGSRTGSGSTALAHNTAVPVPVSRDAPDNLALFEIRYLTGY